MYGAVPLKTIKQALLDAKADGRLNRVKMLDLTNCSTSPTALSTATSTIRDG